MTHICETNPDQCAVCLKFERNVLLFQLKKAEKRAAGIAEAAQPLYDDAMQAMEAFNSWPDDDPRWEMSDEEYDQSSKKQDARWKKLGEALKEGK